MSADAAQMVFVVIGAAGAIAWLCGLLFLLASMRAGHAAPADVPDHFGHQEQLPQGWFLGSVELPGEPRALAEKAEALLTKGGALRVTDRGSGRIDFERAGQWDLMGWGIERGQLQFAGQGGRTRVDFAVEPATSGWLIGLGWAFQFLGLIALVVGGWAISTWVVRAQLPAVRAQTFQYLQVTHFLWPPFLFGGLYRLRRRALARQFALFLGRLPELSVGRPEGVP